VSQLKHGLERWPAVEYKMFLLPVFVFVGLTDFDESRFRNVIGVRRQRDWKISLVGVGVCGALTCASVILVRGVDDHLSYHPTKPVGQTEPNPTPPIVEVAIFHGLDSNNISLSIGTRIPPTRYMRMDLT